MLIKTPEERGRTSLAAAVRKVVLRFAPRRTLDLDVEYTTGRTWIKEDQLSGMQDKPNKVRNSKVVSKPEMDGLTIERTLSRWVDTSLAEVQH